MSSLPDLTHDRSRIGLETSGGTWSYGTIVDLRDRIEDRLEARLRSGQACALVMGANHVSVAALLAVMRTCRPLVLLPATLPPEEIRAALNDASASLLLRPLIGASLATRVAPPGWQEEGEQDGLAFLVRADAYRGHQPLAVLQDAGFLCQLTSGSTGRSRLAVRSVTGLAVEVEAVAHALALTSEDTVLVTSSLAHSYALCGGLLGALSRGAHLVAATGIEETVALARATRPTVIFGLSSSYQALLTEGNRAALSRTRLALSAGAPLPDGLYERMLAWSGIPIRQDYGTTEVGTISVDLGDPAAPTTVGSPLPHVSLRIAPPLRARLHPGEQGEILVRSEAAARWYLEQGEAVPSLDQDGWYRTGDAGSWDGEGRLRLGRRLRPPVITSRGIVDLETVEQVALAMPGVEEAVAVPAENAEGEAGIRLVVVAPWVPVEALRAWCDGHLEPHEVPVTFERRDVLPRSPAGKVLGKYL